MTQDVLEPAPSLRATRAGRRFRGSATLAVGCVLAGLILLLALVSLFWSPYAADDTSGGRLAAPGGGICWAPTSSAVTCSPR